MTVPVSPGGVNKFRTSIDNIPASSRPPLISGLELQHQRGSRPSLTINGEQLGDPQSEKVRVIFEIGGADAPDPNNEGKMLQVGAWDTIVNHEEFTHWSSSQIRLDIPSTALLGLSRIIVERDVDDANGNFVKPRRSNNFDNSSTRRTGVCKQSFRRQSHYL